MSSKGQSLHLRRRIKDHRKENMCHANSLLKRANEKFKLYCEFKFQALLTLQWVRLPHRLVMSELGERRKALHRL